MESTAHNANLEPQVTTSTEHRRPYLWVGGFLVTGSILAFALGASGLLDGLYTDGDGLFTVQGAMASTMVALAVVVVALVIIAFTLRNSLVDVRADMGGMTQELNRMRRELDDEVGREAKRLAGLVDQQAGAVAKQLQRQQEEHAAQRQAAEERLAAQDAKAEQLRARLEEVQQRLADDPVKAVEERLVTKAAELEQRLERVREDGRVQDETLSTRDEEFAVRMQELQGALEELERRSQAIQESHDKEVGARDMAQHVSSELAERTASVAEQIQQLRERLADAEEAPRKMMEDITFTIKERSRFYILMGFGFLFAILVAVMLAWLIGDSPGWFTVQQAFLGTGLILVIMTAAVATVIFGLADAIRVVKRRIANLP